MTSGLRLEPSAPAHVRARWMDLLRGLAIIGVVVLHSAALAAMLSGVPTPRLLEDVNAALMPYRMPLLFMLSGMLLGRSLAKSRGRYYLGKIRGLLWPYLVWVCVYWAVTSPQEWPALEDWVGTSWLWYLWYLGAYYLIAPLAARIPVWVLPVLCWSVSHVVPDEQLTLFFLYAGYFFAGHMVWTYRQWGRRFSGTQWMLVGLAAAALLSLAYVLQDRGVTFLVPLRREELLYAPLTVIGIGGLVLLARRLPDMWSVPVRFLGRNSLVFYLVHYPVQILLAQVLGALALWDWRLHIGVGVVAPLVLGVGLVYARRTPWLDALFVMPWPRRDRRVAAGRA